MSNHDDILKMIKKDMKVLDNSGDEIGTVEWVHFGEAEGPPATGAATPPSEHLQSDLVETVGNAFKSDDLPQELRERLLMRGFVKMDSKKLFGVDRYVMTDQIEKVDKNGVHLTVADSEGLLKGQRLDQDAVRWIAGIFERKNAGAEFVDHEVVEDDNLISSRHPGDLPAFVDACLKRLS